MNTVDKIAMEEGFMEMMYDCPAGKKTIGFGFNLETTAIPKYIAKLWLKALVMEIESDLLEYRWYSQMNEIRRTVITDMVYQMGLSGVLKFKNMIKALEDRNYHLAAVEMLDSNYAKQTPARANRNAEMMHQGVVVS
ncbi:MAG: glycoside hydrolase family protein [Pseudomonadales bacterium]